MKRIKILFLTAVLIMSFSAYAFASAGDQHPFKVTHEFYDGENTRELVDAVDASMTVTEGEEFWVENMSGNATQYVYGHHVDGYDDSGRWQQGMSSIAGGTGEMSYGSGIDEDGKIFMYRNRYIALPLDDGEAVYKYYYQPGLVRKYVDNEGNLLTGENGGALLDKDGNPVPNPAQSYHRQGTAGGLKVPEIPGYELRKETQEGDAISWNEKNRCWVVQIDLHKESKTLTFVYDKYCTVMYSDGVDDEEIFPDETTENVLTGTDTPAYSGGIPTREGYVFKGWSPEISEKVQSDAVYIALWEEEDPLPTEPTEDPDEPSADPSKPSDDTDAENENASDRPDGADNTVNTGIGPKTGDDSGILLYGSLTLIGLIGIGLTAFRRKNSE